MNISKQKNKNLARSSNKNKRFGTRNHTSDPEFLETELNYLDGELSLRGRKDITETVSDSGLVILLFSPSGCKEHFQLADRLRSHWDVFETTSENDALALISKCTISLIVICDEVNVQLSKRIIRSVNNATCPVIYTDDSSTDEIITRVRAKIRK